MKRFSLFAALAAALLVTASAFQTKPVNWDHLYSKDPVTGALTPVPDDEDGRDVKWRCLPTTEQCLYDSQGNPIEGEDGTFQLIP